MNPFLYILTVVANLYIIAGASDILTHILPIGIQIIISVMYLYIEEQYVRYKNLEAKYNEVCGAHTSLYHKFMKLTGDYRELLVQSNYQSGTRTSKDA